MKEAETRLRGHSLHSTLPILPLPTPPNATLSSRCDCATKMTSAAGSPPSPPLQDNVDAERRLREAEDRLREAIEELLASKSA
uniref:Uncharacterized protein n=1 Tax=Quercus lobata TaxID=97700 RepID=A0A7N2L3U2_QUELO